MKQHGYGCKDVNTEGMKQHGYGCKDVNTEGMKQHITAFYGFIYMVLQLYLDIHVVLFSFFHRGFP